MHIVTNLITPYGFHRDEFLYLAMGEHLRLWQMDFPPFIALVGRASHALFGTSLAGIRLGPAFAHAGLVYAATLATSLFGGRRSAQMLAALSVALCPYFMRAGAMLQPVVFDQLWWTLALLAMTIRIKEDDRKHWLGIGVLLGLAALTKFSVAFIAAGFIVALVATPLRKDLTTKWPWIAVLIATVIGHPSITGQIFLNWPVFKQFDELKSSQLSHVSPISFVTDQLGVGPAFLLMLVGMIWLFAGRRRSAGAASHNNGTARSMGAEAQNKDTPPDFRPVAFATATAFLILLLVRGKAYYIAPIYPILIAAGAAAIDEFAVRISPKRPTKVLAVVAAIVALYGMIGLPFGLPLLAPNEMSTVSRELGQQQRTNQRELIPLPQDYADMLGWPELAAKTARVWNALPPADTANAILIGTNYGRAGALDLIGRELGLPPAISAAGSYWFFGPGIKTGDVAVVPANNAEDLAPFYAECTERARTTNPWGVAEEQSVRIYVCRGAKASIQQVWPSLSGRN
ncbi:MAG: glycosyltransferase family 39 protein [Gemmatimonadaceae bacterium]